MKKSKKKSSKSQPFITPLKLSIAFNIFLILLIMLGACIFLVLRDEFNKGSIASLSWTVAKQNEMCTNIDKKSIIWLKSYDSNPEQKKYATLNLKALCRDESYAPYEQQALSNYFKANGLNFENPPSN